MPGPDAGKTAVPIPNAQPAKPAAAADRTKAEPQRTPAAIIGNVNAKSTPVEMVQKRIPPRVNTTTSITVTDGPVTIKVGGQNASNGTVTINGAAELQLKSGTHVINLKGVTQTSPGNANKLQVEAWNGATSLATSNTFSVSSIPQNWSTTLLSRLDDKADPNSYVGIVVQDHWESDSTSVADLNEAKISEQVEPINAKGIFVGAIASNSGYLSATSFTTDQHATKPRGALTETGSVFGKQTCMFKDNRTGAIDIPLKKSGYTISRNITASKTAGKFDFSIIKQGADTTANGISSKAGKGKIVPAPFLVP